MTRQPPSIPVPPDPAAAERSDPDDDDAGSASRTDWSMIVDAVDDEDARDRVLRHYWPAIYAFIRATGRDPDESADLTQGFMCNVMLTRRLLEGADPERGRFRSLMLRALQNYLHDDARRRHRRKRTPPGGSIQPLDGLGMAVQDPSLTTPEAAFDAEWAVALVRRVLEDVRQQCVADSLEPHWEVFAARVVRPMLLGEAPADYDDLIERFSLNDASQAANMMVTVKRRVANAVRREVSRTVNDPTDVSDELGDLMRCLEGGA